MAACSVPAFLCLLSTSFSQPSLTKLVDAEGLSLPPRGLLVQCFRYVKVRVSHWSISLRERLVLIHRFWVQPSSAAGPQTAAASSWRPWLRATATQEFLAEHTYLFRHLRHLWFLQQELAKEAKVQEGISFFFSDWGLSQAAANEMSD